MVASAYIPNKEGEYAKTNAKLYARSEEFHVQIPFADEETCDAEYNEASRDAPEPVERLGVLAGHEHVHAPHARDDVHWQDDRSKNCQFTEDVVGLLRPLVHPDVDLRKVVPMRT